MNYNALFLSLTLVLCLQGQESPKVSLSERRGLKALQIMLAEQQSQGTHSSGEAMTTLHIVNGRLDLSVILDDTPPQSPQRPLTPEADQEPLLETNPLEASWYDPSEAALEAMATLYLNEDGELTRSAIFEGNSKHSCQ